MIAMLSMVRLVKAAMHLIRFVCAEHPTGTVCRQPKGASP
jgi:hypothetical protein